MSIGGDYLFFHLEQATLTYRANKLYRSVPSVGNYVKRTMNERAQSHLMCHFNNLKWPYHQKVKIYGVALLRNWKYRTVVAHINSAQFIILSLEWDIENTAKQTSKEKDVHPFNSIIKYEKEAVNSW